MADDETRRDGARRDDEAIERTERVAEKSASRARMFDVRRIIGGLFVVYGLIVGVAGLFDSAGEIAKAQGVRVNLWTGLGMLLLGLFFLAWQWMRPLAPREVDRPE
jgi:hypothetical protein